MATESEDREELQEQIESVDAEPPQPAAEEPLEDNDDLDADARELADARQAAQAEDEVADTSDGDGGGEEQPRPPPEEQRQPSRRPGPVPYDRFAEVVARGRQSDEENQVLKERLANLEGRIEGLTTTQSKPTEEDPGPSPAERLEAEMEAVAEKFDNGEITARELTREQLRINRALARVERAAEKPPESTPQPRDPAELAREINDDGYVAEATARIIEENPWMEQRTPRLNQALAGELADLQPRAYEMAEADGVRIEPGKRGTLLLRAYLAAAGKEAGLDQIYGATAMPRAAPAQAEQPQTRTASRPPAGASPLAEARRRKTDLRRSMPPDATTAGSPAGPGQEPTEQQIEQMSDEEIEALPAATRRKFLGT